ncbi:MAG TPA: response regulator [Polyangiaceae bacterium]|jgi:DNA-binding response OmpR family regulator
MRKRTALVVEDNPPERDMIAGYLRLAGFEVETAVDYRAAVAALASFRPDIICCDISLPRESGLDLVEYVRGNPLTEWVPILVMSERHSPEDMAQAEHVGANAYLKKPFSRERLDKYVTALLDGPHSSRPSVRRLRRT